MRKSSPWEPWPLPPKEDLWTKRIDNADLELRLDRWNFVHISVLRGINPKFLSLTPAQAAALRDGITELLETQK